MSEPSGGSTFSTVPSVNTRLNPQPEAGQSDHQLIVAGLADYWLSPTSLLGPLGRNMAQDLIRQVQTKGPILHRPDEKKTIAEQLTGQQRARSEGSLTLSSDLLVVGLRRLA